MSSTGSAGSAGTSKASPTTPASALGKVNPNDVVVFLDSGVYTTTLYLSRSGASGQPITLKADDGAVPVIRGPGSGSASGLAATANVSNYVIEGLWFENWAGGIELDWDNTVSNITIRNCVSDFNLRNGISPYRATNVTVEYNIASRNGWGPDSWSSNVNIWGVKGSSNVVRGNVSFHGVDTSSNHSDGNGFILDLTIDQGTALFENNLGFLNGGSCISVTDSASAKLIGNTCYGNSQLAASYMDEFNMGNTCRGTVNGINVAQSPWTFTGLTLMNNVAIPTMANKDGVNVYNTSPCGGGTSYTQSGNYIQKVDPAGVFESVASANFKPKAGGALIDQVTHGTTFATDIGFDPKCIKTETDASKKKYAWWTLAPDLAYMKSVGGIAGCFNPIARPQGNNQEIGAYEYAAASGCSSAGDCNDDDACTTDTCNGGACQHAEIAGCCATAADCDDTNPCTTDSCNGQNQCAHAAVAGCCQSDGACDDGDACTSDTCNLQTHQCATSPISACCNETGDCSNASACVTMSCDVGQHTCNSEPIAGCCSTATDCDDGNPCTTDDCTVETGTCTNAAIAGCCQLAGDCADANACTVDACDALTNTCTNVAPTGCCTSDAECADTDACTLDTCNLTTNSCAHAPDPLCASGGAGGSAGGGTGGLAGSGGTTLGSAGAGGGTGGVAGVAGSGVVTSGGSSNPGDGPVQESTPAQAPGCGCRVRANHAPDLAAIAAAALGVALVARRRRRAFRALPQGSPTATGSGTTGAAAPSRSKARIA